MKLQAPPPWLFEEPAVLGLLHQCLDRLDSPRLADADDRVQLRLTRKTCPELHGDPQEAEQVWALIRSMDKQYRIWQIRGPRVRPGQPDFEQIRLAFDPEAEPVVRQWLNRPLIDPYALIWQEAVERRQAHWPHAVRFMTRSPLRYEQRDAETLVEALRRFGEVRGDMTLREASARCFWGDSKFAENHEAWLHEVFPAQMKALRPRPILLSVVIPAQLQGVLWIENQDSFLHFARQPPPEAEHLALVYCAGFRATSPRIREPGHAEFCVVENGRGGQDVAPLKALWNGALNLPCYFWGDLDFAGMSILAGLRIAFPSMQGWEPGYRQQALLLEQGAGHRPENVGKDLQLDPGVTGCDYADSVLLPLLRQCLRVVDQEAVCWD